VLGGLGGASRDVAATLGLIDEAEWIERGDDAYVDAGGKPSRTVYWEYMHKLDPFAELYTKQLAERGLLEAAKRLAVSDIPAEISALIVTMLEALVDRDRAGPVT